MCTPESYTYDPWGNILTLGANTTTQPNYVGCTQESGFNYNGLIATNNRIAASGFSYDAAGNMTASPGFTYVYDAENHLTTTAGVTYAYDGDGKRLTKSNGTMYWYGASSDPLMETDLSNNLKLHYIFFNGQRVASQNVVNQVNWYFADHLGTARLVFGVNGNDLSDFYPYGGERVHTASVGNHYKFTGKERDSETGLDNFGARFNSSTMGRFMTPDWSAAPMGVPYADFGNPQSLNLYSYVKNNPMNATDVDGHCAEPISFTICAGVVILGIEGIYNHFRELQAKADNARAAKEFEQACASSPQCDVTTVHQQTVSAMKDAGEEAAATALTTVPIVAPPNGAEEIVQEAGAGLAKDAAAEAAKPREQQEQGKGNQQPQSGNQQQPDQTQKQQANQPPPPPPQTTQPSCKEISGAPKCP